ncbi:MAG: hypothetical protein H0W43_10445, partial [Chthoniobacterales bacterium]|nr:hypothetical protein [Chthoniobacterales bacterium]
MKIFVSQLTFFLRTATTRRNIRLLSRFLLALGLLVLIYSVLFHLLMVYEG